MKFLAVLVIAFVAFAAAQDGPTKISSNNVGDIVTVDVKAKASIDNKIDATIISILLKYLNAQGLFVNTGDDYNGNGPNWPNLPNLPSPPQLPDLPLPPVPRRRI